MRILLDAGHGGTDPGAVAELETITLRECDLTLEIVHRLRDQLKKNFPNWEVRLSRVDDSYMSPGARARLIQRAKVDAAVSVHCNSSTNLNASGHEVIYREEDDRGLAAAINTAMNVGLHNRDRGLKADETDLGRKLALLNTPGIPTVIVEPGFLSNEDDRELLLDFSTLSGILASGIEKWAREHELA